MHSKRLKNISVLELKKVLLEKEEQVFLIDVREELEFIEQRITKATFYPLSEFDPEIINKEANNRKIVFYCKSGKRSMRAAEIFLEVFPEKEVFNLTGGIESWKEKNLNIISGTL